MHFKLIKIRRFFLCYIVKIIFVDVRIPIVNFEERNKKCFYANSLSFKQPEAEVLRKFSKQLLDGWSTVKCVLRLKYTISFY